MKRPRLASRDRRALILAAVLVIPVLLYRVAADPYARTLWDVRNQIEVQRDLLARELTILAEAPGYPALTQEAAAALRQEARRLFSGPDALSASAALVNYVSEAARQHRVLVQRSETRTGTSAGNGVLALQIGVRGMSDLEGLLGLLNALDMGSRLVRVEQITIERAQRVTLGSTRDEEILTFTALVSGYGLTGGDEGLLPIDVAGVGGQP